MESSSVWLDLLSLHTTQFMDINFSQSVGEIIMDKTFFNVGLPPKI
jgi:hypothetical protein